MNKILQLSKTIKNAHSGAVRALCYTPFLNNGNSFLSGGDDGLVRLWTWPEYNPITLSKRAGKILCIDCFLDMPLFLSSAEDGKVLLKSFEHEQEVILDSKKVFPSNMLPPQGLSNFISVAHIPQKTLITVVHDLYGIYLWDWNAEQLYRFKGDNVPLNGKQVVVCDTENFLVTNSGKAIYMFDTNTGELIRMFGGNPKGITQQGNALYFDEVSTENNWINKTFESMGGHSKEISCLAVSNDGNWLVTGSEDCTLHRWDVSDLSKIELSGIGIFNGHTSTITDVKFIPFSDKIVSCSLDGTLRIWDLHTTKELFRIKSKKPLTILAVSYHGSKLAVGAIDKAISIFDINVH